MKKKVLAAIMLLSMMLGIIAALAEVTDVVTLPYEGPLPMYVNKKKLPVYEQPDEESKVILKLKGADAVTVELITEDELWLGILVEDTKNGGQKIGWVEAEFMIDTFPQSFCRHKFGKWKVEVEPTCTSTGYRYRLCKICGIADEEEMPKLKHEYGKWKVTKEATCTKKGERTRKCKVCGKKQTEEYLEEHTFSAWKITKEPTCTEKGERVHTCKVCDFEEKQELEKLPHDYAWEIVTEATDHSAGVRVKTCRVCGYNGGEESYDPEGTMRRGAKGEDVYYMQQLLIDQGYLNVGGADGIFGGGTEKAVMQFQKDQDLNPDGVVWPQTLKKMNHEFGPWEIVKPVTRVEAGERMRVCSDCGFEQVETIEAGTTFENGRRGEDVRTLQQMIHEIGYDAGSFDGIYGSKLDNALAAFAADKGLIVEKGRIRPADIDAIVNDWIKSIPDDAWMGEGSADSPVNLALSINLVSEDADSGLSTYSWSLTNLGKEKCIFITLLLTYGDIDYRQENMAIVLDGFELKANTDNSVSGSFTVSNDWVEGDMHFAALAVSEADDTKWLSNTVSFTNETEEAAAKTIAPMPYDIDVNNLPDGEYPVMFDRGDVLAGTSGVFMNNVRVYTQDWYDIVDVNTLAVGDTIIVSGEPVTVTSLEDTDYGIQVNAEQDDGGFLLASEEDSNGFCVRGLSDISTYTLQGTTSLAVDASATFTDGWNIEEAPLTVGYDGIVEALQSSENEYFVQYNTSIRVENGKVVEIIRVFVP